MRCNVSKCRQKIKLIKLINFELRCTSSFSLRRSEGEMPTSLLQAHKAELIHQNKAIRDTNLNSHVYVTSYLILFARGNLEVEKLGWR